VSHLESPGRQGILNFEQDVLQIDFDPRGEVLGILSEGGVVELFELGEASPCRRERLQAPKIMVQCFCLAPGGTSVALGELEAGAFVMAADETVSQSFASNASVVPQEYSVDGAWILLKEGEERVVLTHARSGEGPRRELFVGSLRCARLSRDARSLAAVGHDGSIYLIDVLGE